MLHMQVEDSGSTFKRSLVEAAVSSAMEGGAEAPVLLDALDTLILLCLRAAILHPEWAKRVTRACPPEVDSLAQLLVAEFHPPSSDVA